ncbi:MAG TPA: hypothetical protein VGS57_18420 [Thermoanaerobaculia bacterium]|jgi:hypothetical protein|nr:hypothetical protein [Thermoanaerobaculia bacterium]
MSIWSKAWERIKQLTGDGPDSADSVFLLGPRSAGKTVFLASLFNIEDLRLERISKATQAWKEQTMSVFLEGEVPRRTDFLTDYSAVNDFKDQARRDWQRLASSTSDRHMFQRMMLDVTVSFPRESGKYRVCLPDPSGEIFVQPNLLELEGYSQYLEALVGAMGYVVIVGGGPRVCQGESGQEATAVLKVLHKLSEHAGNASHITRPVAVVMMKMDQHIECCLGCHEKTAAARTSCLRASGLDSERMATLFGTWFHRVNLLTIKGVVAPEKLRFFGMSAYGFGPDGEAACKLADNGIDFVPTRGARPVNLIEPLKWALGVD